MTQIRSSPITLLVGAALAAVCLQAPAQSPAAASAPAPATAKAQAPAAKHPAAPVRAAMDLHTPPLNHVMPSSELRYILASDVSDTDPDATTEVNVKSTKFGVVVPGTAGNQLQAIPWALLPPDPGVAHFHAAGTALSTWHSASTLSWV